MEEGSGNEPYEDYATSIVPSKPSNTLVEPTVRPHDVDFLPPVPVDPVVNSPPIVQKRLQKLAVTAGKFIR